MSNPTMEQSTCSIGPIALCGWLGLVGGLLEVVVIVAQYAYDPIVSVESIRIHRHYLWMIPLSNLGLGLVAGVILSAMRRITRQRFRELSPYAGTFLSVYAPLLAVTGLYSSARLLLAMGLAVRVGGQIHRKPRVVALLVRRSTPFLVLMVGSLMGWSVYHVELAESRTLAALPPAKPDATNVILLVMDNVRADRMSLHGYERETTPNLKILAERGVRFDNARSTAPWTLPSHASMMTGRWPHELSTDVNHPLDSTYPTLAEELKSQGYSTAGFVGNTYYCNAWYGLDRGFSHYEDFPQNRTISPLEVFRSSKFGSKLARVAHVPSESPGDVRWRKTATRLNQDALTWIDAHPDRPFFVFINYYDAHEPFDPPQSSPRQFGLSALPPAERIPIIQRHLKLASGKITASPEKAAEIHEQISQLLTDSFDDCLRSLDTQVGALIDELELRGKLDNTLIVITSDHGEHFGDRGLLGHGHSLYSALIDVPLVILNPKRSAAGTVVINPVSLRDLPATIIDQLGLSERLEFKGESLAHYWQGRMDQDQPKLDPPLSVAEHQTTFPPSSHIPASLGPLWSLVDDEFAYIHNSDGREELYHRGDDPDEEHNLANKPEYVARVRRFRLELDRLLGEDSPDSLEIMIAPPAIDPPIKLPAGGP